MIRAMQIQTEKFPNRGEICLHLDLYGSMLTEHTRDVLDLHYGEDMSLSEIAQNLAITRQAVHDRIRQGVVSLLDYERKLCLVQRHRTETAMVDQALAALKSSQTEQATEILRSLKDML